MLKPRYVLIIILALFVSITVAGFAIDQHFIRDTAEEINYMVSTAAECALRASTMSDEFFTKGTSPSGYTTAVSKWGVVNTASSLENTLRIDIGDGNGFQELNPYTLAYNINQEKNLSADATVLSAYEAMFVNNSSFKSWANKVLTLQYQTPDVNIAVADIIRDKDGNYTAPVTSYRIPKLCTMGSKMFAGFKDFNTTMYDKVLEKTKSSSSSGKYGTNASSTVYKKSKAEKVQNMLSAYDYWEYKRNGYVIANGKELKYTYYLTPTALGLTYIDTNVLDILYRSNLDLLMRSQYLSGGSGYNSIIPHTYFPDADTDFTSTWANNVVNNGSFYYVRGVLTKSSKGSTYSYGWKPTVDYIYITLTPEDRRVLTNNDTSYPAWLNAVTTVGGKTVTYHECLDAMLSQAVSPTTTLKTLAKKYTGTGNYNIILAQATFASEFIIPYQSSPMRGMAEHFGSTAGTYSEQDLNCFTVTTSPVFTQAFQTYGNNALSKIMGRINSSFSTRKSLLQGNMPYVYTTYYAIAD